MHLVSILSLSILHHLSYYTCTAESWLDLREKACHGAMDRFLKDYERSSFVQEPQETGTRRCRGRSLLYQKLGIVIGTYPEQGQTVECVSGKRCEVLVFNCNDRNDMKYDLSPLQLYVRVVGQVLMTADTEIIPISANSSGLRIAFTPPVPGDYNIEARLHFWSDTCSAWKVKNALTGMYLGGMEARCKSSEANCIQQRLIPECDEAAMIVPGARGIAVHVRGRANPSTTTTTITNTTAMIQTGAQLLPRCIDGFGTNGNWYHFSGCEHHSGKSTIILDPRSHKTLNGWSGSLCKLNTQEKNEMSRKPGWKSLHYARPECRYHYPNALQTLRGLEEAGINGLIFIGDSILRSLYSSILDFLGIAADEKTIKSKHKAPVLRIGNIALSFIEYWFQYDFNKIQNRWTKLFEGVLKHTLKPTTTPPTIAVIVNLGMMHQMPGVCNENSGFSRSLMAFKKFLAEWYTSLPEDSRPQIKGIVYGAPSVLGLRNVGVSYGKGAASTQLAMRILGGRAGIFENLEPTQLEKAWDLVGRFHVLDIIPLTGARFDATSDGFHYGGTVRMMQAVGLLNMLCENAESFEQNITGPNPRVFLGPKQMNSDKNIQIRPQSYSTHEDISQMELNGHKRSSKPYTEGLKPHTSDKKRVYGRENKRAETRRSKAYYEKPMKKESLKSKKTIPALTKKEVASLRADSHQKQKQFLKRQRETAGIAHNHGSQLKNLALQPRGRSEHGAGSLRDEEFSTI